MKKTINLSLSLGILASSCLWTLLHAAGTEGADWRIVAADQQGTKLVIVSGAPGAAPEILWRWEPAKDPGVKPGDAAAFGNIDECKVSEDGRSVLVNASGGGVAEVDVATARVRWYAKASRGSAGPHSLAVLPDGCIAVANSTGCDALEIIDVRSAPCDPARQTCRRAAEVSGAHGVCWDARRNCLFVLGYTNLYAYAYSPADRTVRERKRWRFDAELGDPWGHDLTPDGRGGYFLTNVSGVWRFDPETEKFEPVRAERNVKSFSRDAEKGDLMQIPTERWWSDRLVVVGTDGARRMVGPFTGARFYKARWLVQRLR